MLGNCGVMLWVMDNPEYKETKRKNENLIEWCIRQARIALGDPLASLVCDKCGFYYWDAKKVETDEQSDGCGGSLPVSHIKCAVCPNVMEL